MTRAATPLVSELFPLRQRRALVAAASLPDPFERTEAIDEITDELVKLGLCRPRSALATPEPARKGR